MEHKAFCLGSTNLQFSNLCSDQRCKLSFGQYLFFQATNPLIYAKRSKGLTANFREIFFTLIKFDVISFTDILGQFEWKSIAR